MDHLTRRVLAAQAAGMSYGKYVALEFERNGYRPSPRDAEEVLPEDGRTKICVRCGKVFPLGGRNARTKYCSLECYRAANNARMRAKHQKKEQSQRAPKAEITSAVCRNCGKEFSLVGIHKGTKHCSESCRRAYARRRKHRRKEEECSIELT